VSLSVNQSPETFTPSYNDVNYVVSESSGAVYSSSNFKFIAEVVVDASTIAKLKVPIYFGSNNKGVFNIGRLLESYTTHDFKYSDTAASGCTNSFQDYSVKFGEEYSASATGTVTEYLNLTSASGTVWNAALNPITFVSFDSDTYAANNSSRKFLTSVRSQIIHRTQKVWLYALRGAATNLRIVYSDSTTATITLPTTKMVRVPVNLSTPSGATYFDCYLRDVDGVTVSETYRFTIKDECSKYDTYDLFFLNRLGGFDSFRFNRVSKSSYDITRKTFRQNQYTLDNTAVSWTYGTDSFSNVQYYEESKQKLTIFSNWITDTESIWLRELVESPVVYLWDGTTLQAVNITNAMYEEKKWINDKMFNLQLDIEFSFVDKKQRR
jgi:hypothetical protein